MGERLGAQAKIMAMVGACPAPVLLGAVWYLILI